MEFELMKDQLHGDYREVLEAAQAYGVMSHVSQEDLIDRLTELYDILLTAQTEEKEVRRIVGSDTERFCKELYQGSRGLKLILERIYAYAWVIFALEVLMNLQNIKTVDNSPLTNLFPYIGGIMISLIYEIVCRFLVLPNMFKSKKIKPMTLNMISLFGLAAMIVSYIIFAAHVNVRIMISVIPLIALCGAYILVFFVVRSAIRYRNCGTIFNMKKMMLKDSYYRELNDTQTDRLILGGISRDYEKLSKKETVTKADFLDKLKSQRRWSAVGELVFNVIIGIAYIMQVVKAVEESQTITDVLLYALIAGVITFFIWNLLSGGLKRYFASQLRIVRGWEASDMEWPEYAATYGSKD